MKLIEQITNFFDWNLPISRKEGLLAMFVAFTPVMVASLVWTHQMISGAIPILDPKDYVLPWYMYLAGLISVPVGWTIGFRRAKAIKLHLYWMYLWMIVWAIGVFVPTGYLGKIFDFGLGLYIWFAPNKVSFAKPTQ